MRVEVLLWPVLTRPRAASPGGAGKSPAESRISGYQRRRLSQSSSGLSGRRGGAHLVAILETAEIEAISTREKAGRLLTGDGMAVLRSARQVGGGNLWDRRKLPPPAFPSCTCSQDHNASGKSGPEVSPRSRSPKGSSSRDKAIVHPMVRPSLAGPVLPATSTTCLPDQLAIPRATNPDLGLHKHIGFGWCCVSGDMNPSYWWKCHRQRKKEGGESDIGGHHVRSPDDGTVG